ncbi:MAG: hypothetical protein MK135_10940 [Polyangiaceae bacterium]|nr:hypothetical protein [Polyangiaceae bacterium]
MSQSEPPSSSRSRPPLGDVSIEKNDDPVVSFSDEYLTEAARSSNAVQELDNIGNAATDARDEARDASELPMSLEQSHTETPIETTGPQKTFAQLPVEQLFQFSVGADQTVLSTENLREAFIQERLQHRLGGASLQDIVHTQVTAGADPGYSILHIWIRVR